jgi:hypothetical protein
MRAFKNHNAADRFCREHGELRHLSRSRRRHNQTVSASLSDTIMRRQMPTAERTMIRSGSPLADYKVQHRPCFPCPP